MHGIRDHPDVSASSLFTWLHVLMQDSDGNRGQIQYRGHPIQELFQNNDYEDVLYLLMWGKLPTQAEKLEVRRKFAAAMVPTKTVVDTIAAFP